MDAKIQLPQIVTPPPSGVAPDLTRGSPDNFPVSALPPIVREVAEDFAKVYQVPVCLPAMTALAVLSGAIGQGTVARGAYKDKATSLNIYALASSERGTGKGNIGEQLARPLTERSAQLAERHKDIVAQQRGEIGILKKEIQKLESIAAAATATGADRHRAEAAVAEKHLHAERLERESKRKRTLHVANATGPGLARALGDNHETTFSFSSEAGAALRVALGRHNDDGGGDFDVLLMAYSRDCYKDDRMGREGITLTSPCVALLWLVQGCVLRELLANPEAFDRGLTARVLTFATGAERQLADRRSLATTTGEKWRAFIDKILDIRLEREREEPAAIEAAPAAREVFADFSDESVKLGRGPFADLDGELSRWGENAIKVAGLIAVAEDTPTISADQARRGCEIVRWAGYSYLSLLTTGRRERQREQRDRLVGILRDKGGTVTLRDLERNNAITKPVIAGVMAAFPGDFIKERVTTGKAGQPSVILRLPGAKSAKSDTITPADTAGGDNADKADFAEGDAA